MSKKFKIHGKIVDRQNADIDLVKKLQRAKLKEEKKKYPEEHFFIPPDEFDYIKNFASKKKKIEVKKPEFFFDFNDDGKPLAIKKQSRVEKARRPFTLRGGKKVYHEFHKL
mgnify:CR=1 FL=1|tara:strand:+ start:1245 stop:1577 length:333 start_codon:yes stop_codon:yes gene_type:complete